MNRKRNKVKRGEITSNKEGGKKKEKGKKRKEEKNKGIQG